LAELSHVGFLKNPVAGAEPERVRTMFGSIAPRYDLANHTLSCGFDFYWRKRASQIVQEWQPRRVLDLATGTGDLALVLQKTLPDTEIVGADFSEEMLSVARAKGLRQTALADARQLPFENESFDVVTIAFGLRNLPDWSEGLREMRRILRRGGHLLVLEFSLPAARPVRALYRFYLHHWVPLLGSTLTNQKNAYDYLGESIENFPSGNAMIHLVEESGFDDASAEPLTAGIVTIYTGRK
jgi:demethylmenaquinone methyltransferase/2-methoxy-6-polyprenyl-1,4-benzoquinol methylase